MAEDFLEEIYTEAIYLTELKKMMEDIRLDIISTPVSMLNEMIPNLILICQKCAHENQIVSKTLYNALEKLNRLNEDHIYLGDCIEKGIIPAFQAYLDTYEDIDVDDGEGIRFFSSSSKFLTMQMTNNNRYYHSSVDPMFEAYLVAKKIFRPEVSDYCILGAGLGYLPYQLYCYSRGTAKIHVFELNEKIVEYGKQYGVLTWVPIENIEITVSDDLLSFCETVDDKGAVYYIHDIVSTQIDVRQKDVLSQLLITQQSLDTLSRDMELNVYYNLKNIEKTILDYDKSKTKKDIIIIAGGPSVDDNINYLKEMQGVKTLICVGTVFTKLIKNGITPDLAVFSDPLPALFHQIKEVCEEKIPIIIFGGTCKYVAEKYKGDKYLALSPYLDVILKGNKKVRNLDGVPRLESGSTVTVAAVSVAIYFGAKNIELVGVDLSFPGGVSHAKGTPDYSVIDESNHIWTENVKGEKVATDELMIRYKEELECIISRNHNIAFYNLSAGGAKIEGTILKTEF